MKIIENMKVFENFFSKNLLIIGIYRRNTIQKYQKQSKNKKTNKFFCKTLDIFLKDDKIILVGRVKSLSNKNKFFYKEIFANDQYRNCKKSHRSLGWT